MSELESSTGDNERRAPSPEIFPGGAASLMLCRLVDGSYDVVKAMLLNGLLLLLIAS